MFCLEIRWLPRVSEAVVFAESTAQIVTHVAVCVWVCVLPALRADIQRMLPSKSWERSFSLQWISHTLLRSHPQGENFCSRTFTLQLLRHEAVLEEPAAH